MAAVLPATLAAILAAASIGACAGSATPPAADVQPDDGGLALAVSQGKSGAEVTFDAVVVTEPADSHGHERFNVTSPAGQVLEIDHNNSLAPEAPVHVGDHIVIRGRLYIDPGPRVGVHCTHAHTSSGCPQPGFIRLGTTLYQ